MRGLIFASIIFSSVFGIGRAGDALQLGGTLDANGNRITNVEGLDLTSAAVGKIEGLEDVCIAVRTDGLSGSGTEIDPLDGSTKDKFDAIMKGYIDAEATDVHFA